MKSQKIKELYIEFFKSKGHKEIPQVSLVPKDDPSVLFTTAGMHPLIPYLKGEKHPQGKRLVNIQRCLRTDDIDEVGDTVHNTFFEMLGNWSFGDYWKKEICEWSYEFLTSKKYLGIDPKKLVVTVFKGDKNLQKDEETAKSWQDIGFKKDQIFYLGIDENFWGPIGEIGPCGPDTEMFFDTGKKRCSKGCDPSCNCGKYIEVWNNVFIGYNKIEKGDYQELKQKNVDTGVGLERLAMVLQNKDSVYETDIFKSYFDTISKELPKAEISEKRIVCDHLRAILNLIQDKVVPSNKDQGYLLRRLIRRVVFIANKYKILPTELYKIYSPSEHSLKIFKDETDNFQKTLERGLRKLKIISGIKTKWEGEDWKPKELNAEDLFDLYQTCGFPMKLTLEEAKKLKIPIREHAEKNFKAKLLLHQEISRRGAKKKFKGGLADQSDRTIKLHSATHLLHAALRKVLGSHVEQRGSNINPERTRFDFAHNKKMTADEIEKVEGLVNQQIKKKISVKMEEMSIEEAKKFGALGIFERKYGDKVKVYTIGDSREICGGPHVKSTSELGKFKILKEGSSSRGIRRIKANLV